MPNYHDTLKAKKAIETLIKMGMNEQGLTDANKREALDAAIVALEFARKVGRADTILREELAKLDTTVNLGLPDVAPVDFSRDIEAIRKIAENEATSITAIGDIIAAAAPFIATAVFAA